VVEDDSSGLGAVMKADRSGSGLVVNGDFWVVDM
jgi:hypothetical protein